MSKLGKNSDQMVAQNRQTRTAGKRFLTVICKNPAQQQPVSTAAAQPFSQAPVLS